MTWEGVREVVEGEGDPDRFVAPIATAAERIGVDEAYLRRRMDEGAVCWVSVGDFGADDP